MPARLSGDDRREVAGIAVAGMPARSPGMGGFWTEPYDVIVFGRDGGTGVSERR